MCRLSIFLKIVNNWLTDEEFKVAYYSFFSRVQRSRVCKTRGFPAKCFLGTVALFRTQFKGKWFFQVEIWRKILPKWLLVCNHEAYAWSAFAIWRISKTVFQLLSKYAKFDVLAICKKLSGGFYYLSLKKHSFFSNQILKFQGEVVLLGFEVKVSGFQSPFSSDLNSFFRVNLHF